MKLPDFIKVGAGLSVSSDKYGSFDGLVTDIRVSFDTTLYPTKVIIQDKNNQFYNLDTSEYGNTWAAFEILNIDIKPYVAPPPVFEEPIL
jgi:hypothetical protein